MKRWPIFLLCLAFALPAFTQQKEEDRLKSSYEVMKAVAGMPDGIPRDLLNKAECVVVFPSVKKAAFVVGASYGRGVMTCRSGANFRGPWSAPAFFALEGGSFGLQIGGEATDFVLLIMNEDGATLGDDKQGKTRRRCLGRGRSGGTNHFGGNRYRDESRNSFLVAQSRSFCRRIAGRVDLAIRR